MCLSRSRVTTNPDLGSSGRAWARGRRTSTPPCMMGAVIMKMMSSTNATSTRDVTLISAFKGSSPCPRRPPPPPTRPAIYSLPSRAMVPMISWAKPSSSPANSPRRFTNKLYAITEGTATASPATVVTSASATRGARDLGHEPVGMAAHAAELPPLEEDEIPGDDREDDEDREHELRLATGREHQLPRRRRNRPAHL